MKEGGKEIRDTHALGELESLPPILLLLLGWMQMSVNNQEVNELWKLCLPPIFRRDGRRWRGEGVQWD